ncbi:MAG: tandem-95 repeat protein [Armatimonadota bacterium]
MTTGLLKNTFTMTNTKNLQALKSLWMRVLCSRSVGVGTKSMRLLGGMALLMLLMVCTSSTAHAETITLAATAPPGVMTYCPTNTQVTLTATTSGGATQRVKFYQNGTLIGTDDSDTYSILTSQLANGTYAFKAEAYVYYFLTHQYILIATSSTVTITVINPINHAPVFDPLTNVAAADYWGTQTIPITGVGPGGTGEESQTVTMTATSSDTAIIPNPTITGTGATRTLSYTPIANSTGTATITVTAQDDGGTANGGVDIFSRTFTITVVDANHPPSFTKGSDQLVVQNCGPQTVTGWATNVSAGAEDEAGQTLTFTVTNNNNVLFASQPTISLTGTLTFTPAPDATGTATVTVQLQDNGSGTTPNSNTSAAQTFTIMVNDVPVANTGTLTTNEDTANTGTLTVTDAYHSAVTYSIVTNGTKGTATITNAATGAYSYTPSPNANGTDTFTFKVNDGYVDSNVATVTVTITVVNDAPVITEGSTVTVVCDEDNNPTAFSLTLNATDAENDTLTWSISTAAGHGTASVSGTGTMKVISYTPVANYYTTTPDSFVVRVADPAGSADTITVSVTVNPRNDPPVNTVVPAISGTSHVGSTLTRSTSTWNDTADSPHAGNLTGAAQWQRSADNVTWTDITGATSSTYVLALVDNEQYIRVQVTCTDDGYGTPTNQSAVAYSTSRLITNAVPVITQGSTATVTCDEGSNPMAFSLTLNATDADNDTLTWSIANPASHGTASASGTGTSKAIAYTPALDFNGTDTFVVQVADIANSTDTITVTVTVNPRNDAPVNTVAPSFSGIPSVGQAMTANPGTWNDDKDNPNPGTITFSYQWQRSNPPLTFPYVFSWLDINNATGASYILQATDYNKYIRVRVTATDDGYGTPAHQSAVAYSDGKQIAYNSSPVITEGSTEAVSCDEENAPSAFALTLHASDEEGDTITWSIATPASHGTASASGIGTSKAITYTPAMDYFGTDSFVVRADDNFGGADTIAITVTITAVNDAPVAENGTLAVTEDAATTGTLVATDADGDALTYSVVAQGTQGTVTITDPATGAYSYAPNANATGTDTFTFKANDGTVDSNTATITMTITAVNDAPVNTVAPSITGTPHVGQTLTANPGTWNDDKDSRGPETISYSYQWVRATAADGSGAEDLAGATNATYTVVAADNGQYLSVKVTATDNGTPGSASTMVQSGYLLVANTAPMFTEGEPMEVTCDEDNSPTAFSLTLHATDADGDTLTWSIDTAAGHGTASATGQGTSKAITYQPDADYNGPDTFKVRVEDGLGGTATLTINVTITAVNDAPVNTVAPSITGTPHVRQTLTVNPGTWNDDKDSPTSTVTLTYQWQRSADNQTWTDIPGATGETYVPPDTDNGQYLRVLVTGTDTGIGVPASQSTTVASAAIQLINANPTAVDDTATPSEDIAITISVLANDGDTDGDTIQVTGASGTSHGTLTYDATTVTYTPASDYNGADSFTYTISDGLGGTAQATVNVTVTAVNDVPSFTIGADQPVNEDCGAQTVANWATAISAGPNEAGQLLDFQVTGNTNTALFSVGPAVDSTGKLTYTPATDANGTATITLVLHDDGGIANGGVDTSAELIFTITVTAVNDPPVNTVAPSITGTPHVGQTLTANPGTWNDDKDSRGPETISYSYQWVRATAADGSGAEDLAGATNATYTVVMSDNGKYLSVKVTAIDSGTPGTASTLVQTGYLLVANTAPVITDGETKAVECDEDVAQGAFTFTLQAIDPDGDALSWSTFLPSHGQASATETGTSTTVTYTPDVDYYGPDSFDVQVSDGLGGVDTISVTVTVKPVNDAPVNTVAPSITGTLHVGQTLTANPGTWTDEKDSLTSTITFTYQWQRSTDNQTWGNITGATGATNIPVAVDNGQYLRVQVTGTDDGVGTPSSQSTVAMSTAVQLINANPIAVNDSADTNEDTEVTINVLGNDSDPDGDTLQIESVGNASQGTATIVEGQIKYTPALNSHGSDTFTYVINDGLNGTATATVTVTIAPVNDAPVNTVVPSITGIPHVGQTLTANPGTWNDAADAPNPGTITYSYQWQRSTDNATWADITEATVVTYLVVMADHNKYLRVKVTGTDDGYGTPATQSTVSYSAGQLVTNAPPEITEGATIDVTCDEDNTPTAFSLTLHATDVDNDTLNWSIGTPASQHGLATASGTGTSIVVQYSPTADYYGNDSFVVQVSDGHEGVDTITVNVIVTPVIDTPVALDGTLEATEDATAMGTLAATDVDGDTLIYSVTDGMKGTVTISTNPTTPNSYTYIPNPNANGTDTFTFMAYDGTAYSNISTIMVTIAPVNDPPVNTVPPSITGIFFVGQTLTANLGTWNDDKDTTEPGTITFAYQWECSTDNANWVAIAGATGANYVLVGMDINKYLRVEVTGTDNGVGAPPNQSTVAYSTALLVTNVGTGDGLTGTYYDNDNFTGTTVTRIDPTLNFTWTSPAPGIGEDTFSVCWTGDVQAQLNETYTFYVSTAGEGVRLWVNDQVLIDSWNNPVGGDLTATMTLVAGQRVPIRLEYREDYAVAYAKLFWSSPNTTKTIIPQSQLYSTQTNPPANVPPVVGLTAPTTSTLVTQGLATTISATAADSDGTVTKVEFFANAVKVSEDLTTPYACAWTPTAAGTCMFTAVATDDDGATRTSPAVTLTVNAPATVSLIVPTNGARYAPPVSLTLQATASDPDGPISRVRFYEGGTYIAYDDSAPYTFNWGAGKPTGTYTFTAEAYDNNWIPTMSAPVTITIGGIIGTGDGLTGKYYDNEDFTGPRVIQVDPTVNYDWHGYTDPTTGIDLDTFSVHWVGEVQAELSETYTFYLRTYDEGVRLWVGNQLIIDRWECTPTGDLTGTMALVAGQHYPIRLDYREETGAASVQLSWSSPSTTKTIIPQSQLYSTQPNLAPMAQGGILNATEDTTATGTLVATDFNCDDLTFSLEGQGNKGTVTISTDPATPNAYTYVPNPNANGTDTFTFKAYDGTAYSNIATIEVVITSVNDLPTVEITDPVDGHIFPSTTTSYTITATASDVEGLQQVQFLVNGTAIGTDIDGTDGWSANWTGITPGSYTLTAIVTDTDGATTTSAPIAVRVNAKPVAVADDYTVDEDVALTTADGPGVLSNDSDQDSDPLTAILDAQPTHGTLSLTSTGAFEYIPATNFHGTDSFTYHVNDGTDDSELATVTITINPVNDAPVFDAIANVTVEKNYGTQTISITGVGPGGGLDEAGQIVSLTATSSNQAIVPNPTISGTDATRTLSFTPETDANGSVIITVTATDDGGGTTCSFVRSFYINITPTISLITPSPGETFLAGNPVTIGAAPLISSGSVARVEFYQETTKLGEVTSAPFIWRVYDLQEGSYTFTAKLVDTNGATGTSIPCAVTVLPREETAEAHFTYFEETDPLYMSFLYGRLDSIVNATTQRTMSYTYCIAPLTKTAYTKTISLPQPGGVNGERVTIRCTYDFEVYPNDLNQQYGNILKMEYRPHGAPAYILVANVAHTIDASGARTVTLTDAKGRSSLLEYNAECLLTRSTDPVGNVTTLQWNGAGQLTHVTFPKANASDTGSGSADLLYLYPGGPLQQRKLYDKNGVLVYQKTLGRDAMGVNISTTIGNGVDNAEMGAILYDAIMRTTSFTDARGYTTLYHYDDAGTGETQTGELLSVQYPDSTTVSYTPYDMAEHTDTVTDGNGVTTTYEYQALNGSLTDVTVAGHPEATIYYTYNAAGDLISLVDNSSVQAFTYDQSGHVLARTFAYNGVPLQTIAYTYNPDSTRKTMTTPSGTTTYGYDETGSLTAVTDPWNRTSSWQYTASTGIERWQRTLGNGVNSVYDFDGLGQLKQLETTHGANLLSAYSGFDYDGAGAMKTFNANVPVMTQASGTTDYTYNAYGQLTSESTTRVGGTSQLFNPDFAGNMLRVTNADVAYNDADQYDRNFDATNKFTGFRDKQTQQLEGATRFEYDSNGNPLRYKDVPLTFDVYDQPTSFGGNTLTVGNSSGTNVRAWKQNSTQRTYFIYDGLTPVCEIDAVGAVVATNVFGPDGLVERQTAAGNTTWYAFDPHGNVAHRVGNNGDVQSSDIYDATGNLLTGDTSDPYGAHAQDGYYTDRETGLQLCTFRYYDPAAVRFLTRDPIGYTGGANLYGYCGGDPVNSADPLGLYSLDDALDSGKFFLGQIPGLAFGLGGAAIYLAQFAQDPIGGIYQAANALNTLPATMYSSECGGWDSINPYAQKNPWMGGFQMGVQYDTALFLVGLSFVGPAGELGEAEQLGKGGGLGKGGPFKGMTALEIDRALRSRGFEPRGPDPLNGKGGYVNPKTGRSYHIDEGNSFGEKPHVDINYKREFKASRESQGLPLKKKRPL